MGKIKLDRNALDFIVKAMAKSTKLYSIVLGGLSAVSLEGAVVFVENFDSALDTATTRAFGFGTSVLGWGESNIDDVSGPTRFYDFIGDTATEAGGSGAWSPAGGTGATPGIGPLGYLYTEIGSSGGDPTLTISLDNYWRSGGGIQRNQLTVEIFSLPAADSFAFAEFGNDILGTGTSVGSFTVEPPSASGEVNSVTETIDVSGVAPDARLFVRFSNPNGGPEAGQFAYVDNVSITSVPEPSSFLLAGLGLLGLTVRRRR